MHTRKPVAPVTNVAPALQYSTFAAIGTTLNNCGNNWHLDDYSY
jgi:hypothetical protein